MLLVVLFLAGCEDMGTTGSSFDPSLYGESQIASQDYIEGLNNARRQTSFPRTGEGMSRWVDDQVSGPTTGMCVDTREANDIGDVSTQLTNEQKEFLENEVGDPPAVGGSVTTELPDIDPASQDVYKYGYYRYNDGDRKVFGTERTIWRLKAAGKLLAQKGIVMGVGDISSRGGPTRGHAEHQQGQDVDLRLVGPDGMSKPCTVSNSSCYDREKTFEMIKTLIDVDPTKVDKILINDPTLRRQINTYYQQKTGSSRSITAYCAGHDNHVHFSWKRR